MRKGHAATERDRRIQRFRHALRCAAKATTNSELRVDLLELADRLGDYRTPEARLALGLGRRIPNGGFVSTSAESPE